MGRLEISCLQRLEFPNGTAVGKLGRNKDIDKAL